MEKSPKTAKASPATEPLADEDLRPAVEHSFTRQDANRKTVVPVLRRVGRHMSNGIRTALEPIAGVKVQVAPLEPEFTLFEAWADNQPEFISLNLFALPPMKGRIALRMNPNMIGALIDAFFGGTLTEPALSRKEFTRTDIRLINRLAEAIGTSISEAWGQIGEFSLRSFGHVTTADGARICAANARLVVQRFRLSFPDNVRFELDMLYPLDTLNSVQQALDQSAVGEDRSTDPIWREKLAHTVSQVCLPVRSVLARPVMTLPELAALKPGDIIPIPPARNLPLIIGDRVFARGSLGEQNGLTAFRIETIERG